MIKPIDRASDYLEFECDKCGAVFHHAIEISHDAPTHTDAQRYDIRNWTIMKIVLQCPSCKSESEGEFKLALREDLAEE